MRARSMIALAAPLLLAAPALGAQTAPSSPMGASGAPSSRFRIVPTLGAMSPAAEQAEERRALARASRLRASVIAAGRWAPLGDDGCDAGSLRTFADSAGTSATADSAQRMVAELEYLVIARGAGEPLATPVGRDLLSTVVAWESGASTPAWDVAAGAPERRAVSAGLSGRQNPVTNFCGPEVSIDTARVLIPAVAGVRLPTAAPQPVVIYTDPTLVAAVRRRVLAGPPAVGASFPTLYYTRFRTVALWGDYAVVSVAHEGDRVAGAPPAQTAGGAAYLFHRVNGTWRLLAVPRTWA
jgi:hypothetical protein